MLRAVLSYPMHPEHGVVTIPFPIPEEEKVYLVPAKGSRYQSYDTMQKLQGIFELYGFFRCHQSFLVRLDAIQGVYLDETRNCHKILLFGSEEQIPLSRGKYPELREQLSGRGLTII